MGLLDNGNGYLIVRGFFHDLMVQNEAVLVFDDTNPQPQLHRHAGLALANPLGMGLKNGKDFLFMWDDFALKYPATNLIDLPFSMDQVAFESRQ